MGKLFGSGMGIPDPYPTHGHPYPWGVPLPKNLKGYMVNSMEFGANQSFAIGCKLHEEVFQIFKFW